MTKEEEKPSAHDALCLYEAELARLRIDYLILSCPARVAAQARAVINAYYVDSATQKRQFAAWQEWCKERR